MTSRLTRPIARSTFAMLFVCALPFWLFLSSVRIVMTEAFLYFEYSRPDFPADPYGFSQSERLAYAPYALRYLRNDQDATYLAELVFPTGGTMYTPRELSHMADVKAVTQAALGTHIILTIGLLLLVLLAGRKPSTRPLLWHSVLTGALLTLVLLGSATLIVVLNWEFFFEEFHRIFFAEGSWRFQYSDTLIRLFPERFWIDAAIAVGLLAGAGAIMLGGVAFWQQRSKP